MPKLDFRYLKDFISEEEFSEKVQKAEEARKARKLELDDLNKQADEMQARLREKRRCCS